jgi:hypothetical protein
LKAASTHHRHAIQALVPAARLTLAADEKAPGAMPVTRRLSRSLPLPRIRIRSLPRLLPQ